METVGTAPSTITLTTDADGSRITMEDRQLTLTLSKKIKDSISGLELPGASLTLWDVTDAANPVEVANWASTAVPMTLESTIAQNGAGGYAYTYLDQHQHKPLIAGHSYRLEEGTPPAGYKRAAAITFTLDATGALTDVANGEASDTTVTMRDEPTVLTVEKKDEVGNPVQTAVITLYIDLGTDTAVLGNSVYSINTNNTGSNNVTGILSLDTKYVAVETYTPLGNETAAPVRFTLDSDGTKQIAMVDPRTVVYVGKADIEKPSLLLGGATLMIYDSKLENGVLVPDTTSPMLSDPVTTSANSPTPVYGLERNHTYFLYELTAPDGYLVDHVTYTAFTVRAGGIDPVYSYDPQTTVLFRKLDTDGVSRLKDATLRVVVGDGASYTESDVVDTWQTSDTEDHSLRGLLVGQTYTLLEVSAPSRYITSTLLTHFQISLGGDVVDPVTGAVLNAAEPTLVTYQNTPTEVTFSKTSLTGGPELKDAVLTLTDITVGMPAWSLTWTTDGITPKVLTGALITGHTYTLTEVTAPEGYTLAETITFTVGVDGKVSATDESGQSTAAANGNGTVDASANLVTMKDAQTRIWVSKVDATTKESLAGAEFKIVPAGSDGKPLSTAVPGYETIVSAATPVQVVGLPAGSYFLVETKAPVGTDASGDPVYYELADDLAFTVTDTTNDDVLHPIVVEDTRTNVTILKLDTNSEATGTRLNSAILSLVRNRDNHLMGTHTFDGVTDWILNNGEMEPGEMYTLSETLDSTPEGYLHATTMEFQFVGDGTDRWIIVDDPIPFQKIVVQKTWNDSFTKHPVVTFNLMRFDKPDEIYRQKLLLSGETSVAFENLLSTDSLGNPYTYTVEEVTPDGYLPGSSSQTTSGQTITYTYVNTPTTQTIHKVDAVTGEELAGAKLILVPGDGKSYLPEDIVDAWTSGQDGQNADGTNKPHVLTGLLTVGSQYTLIEQSAPVGYLRDGSITFTVAADGTNSYTGSTTLTMRDQPVRVALGKVDNLTGDFVKDAKLSVYDAAWTPGDSTMSALFSFVSAESLTTFSGKLTAGETYWLVETEAPDGYAVNGSPLAFTAPSDGGIIAYSISDARIYRFAKISTTTGNDVPGAKLMVTDASGAVVIPEWTTTGQPMEFTNMDLKTGKPILVSGVTYRLVETAAPANYELNTTPVTFTLDANGLINGGVLVTMTNKPTTNTDDDTLDLTIRKTWVDNSNAGNTRPTAGLTVYLYRKLSTATAYGDPYLTLTVPNRTGNTWYLTVVGLPRYNGDGVEYDYRAREAVPTGYTVTYTNDGFTMVNTYPSNNVSPTPTPIPTITATPAPTTTHIATRVEYVDGNWVYIDDNEVPLGIVPQTGDETDYRLLGVAVAAPLLLALLAGWYLWRRKRRAHAGRGAH